MSAALPAVSRLSPVVVRLLGHNPGPMTLQGTNTYLIGSGSRRLLLDAGEAGVAQYQHSLAATLASEQCALASLVISHWHHDHIGGAAGVVQAQPQVVVHKFPRLEDQLEGLTISPLEDGQLLEVEGASCRVIHTPGHTTDHVMLYLEQERALFSADCILGEGTAVFESLYHYMESLERILQLDPAPTVIFPGHGPVVTNPVEKIKFYIEHRLAREEQIFHCLQTEAVDGGIQSMQIVKIVYAKTPENLHRAAQVNVEHHLEKLKMDGKVSKDGSFWKAI